MPDILTRDHSIRCFVPVRLYGDPLDLEKLDALKQDFDLAIVEDCAQAIARQTRRARRRNGGPGGRDQLLSHEESRRVRRRRRLLTNDPPTASRARALRNYGQSDLYLHDEFGLNSRLDELHAAVLSDALLPNLERWTEARRQIASRYRREIQHFRTITPAPSAEPVWHLFPIFVEAGERDNIREHLLGRGIASGVHYPRLIPDQPAMQLSVSYEVAAEPANARRLAASELSLPIHPFLREDEIQLVVASCSAR